MLIEYLEQLRKQPVEVRKKYTLFFTTVITTCIVLIYVISLFINGLGTRSLDKENLESEISKEKTVSKMFESSNVFIDNVDIIAPKKENNEWSQDFEEFDLQTQTASSSSIYETEEKDTVFSTSTIFQ